MDRTTFRCLALAALLLAAGLAHAQDAADTSSVPALLPLLMRWVHIISAIVMLGGTLFFRSMVIPALRGSENPDAARSLRAAIHGRWRKLIPWLILAFLVSGFYNYLAVTRQLHPDTPAYHMIFGIKFLLSLGVFFIASMLISTRNWSSKVRERAESWIVAMLVLAFGVVLLGGYMKVMP
jgi:hypothetical protein